MTGEVVRTGGSARWATAAAVLAWISVRLGGQGGPRAVAWGLGVGIVLAGIALVRQRPRWALAGALALVAVASGAHSAAGLTPAPGGPWTGEVTLVGDPDPVAGGVRADVAGGGRRLELQARGGDAGVVRPLLTGDRVVVTGRVRGSDQARHRGRHVTGVLVADAVQPGAPASAPAEAANALHRLLRRGAAPLDEAEAALLAGLVLGDDRDLPPELEDAMRAGGLGHLTAVSGQNVAFALALAGPLLRRAHPLVRVAAVLGLLAGFVVVTRVEPSVVRAAAMAAIAALATGIGRPVAGRQLLAGAVAVLVVVDPVLTDSLGFQLSVAACAGILLAAAPVAEVLPGPDGVTGPVAVTLSAQAGVAPLLVMVGIPVPLAAVVANPLAGPAAGGVMAWGMIAGVLAGLMPALAAVLHLPTRALLAVVTSAATLARWLPLGQLDRGSAPLVAVVVAVVVACRHRWGRRGARAALVVAAAAMVAVPAPTPGSGRHDLAAGAEVHVGVGGAVVVVDGRADVGQVLGRLRVLGVANVDVVVRRSDSPRAVRVATALRDRWPRATLVGPDQVPPGGLVVAVAGVELRLTPGDPLGVADAGGDPPPRSDQGRRPVG